MAIDKLSDEHLQLLVSAQRTRDAIRVQALQQRASAEVSEAQATAIDGFVLNFLAEKYLMLAGDVIQADGTISRSKPESNAIERQLTVMS